ncbi:MAG: hypothetical protein WCC48_06555 [Anaeromyxobacteraceae bacterium]
MHRLVIIAAAVAALAAGCSTPCQDLGDRICRCSPTGTSKDTCEQQVSNVVSSVNPNDDQDARCSDLLDRCHAPDGVDFCEWLSTADGKTACGLAY